MILIVEDDPQVARLIELVLRRNGADSETLDNGSTAIERVRKEPPAMIFADLGIKGVSGDELCRIMKADEDLCSIPFVVLSGDRDIQERASSCGADEFLGKPFEFDDLTEILDKYADHDETD